MKTESEIKQQIENWRQILKCNPDQGWEERAQNSIETLNWVLKPSNERDTKADAEEEKKMNLKFLFLISIGGVSGYLVSLNTLIDPFISIVMGIYLALIVISLLQPPSKQNSIKSHAQVGMEDVTEVKKHE